MTPLKREKFLTSVDAIHKKQRLMTTQSWRIRAQPRRKTRLKWFTENATG